MSFSSEADNMLRSTMEDPMKLRLRMNLESEISVSV